MKSFLQPRFGNHAGIIHRFQRTPPVDANAVAYHLLGAPVEDVESTRESGWIRRDKESYSGFAISVRNKDNCTRQRFTVSVLLAHYILHVDKIGMWLAVDFNYASGLSILDQTQAIILASDLLMPFSLLAKEPHDNVARLASLFEVTPDAMKLRLKQYKDTLAGA